MMNIIFQLIVGLIIGAVARLIVSGTGEIGTGLKGWLITALLGIGGSFIGTVTGKLIWKENYAAGWFMSILGAVLLVFLYVKFF